MPELIAEFTDRWSLTVGPPFQPGGSCAWVAPARDRAGRDLVLKLAWQHDEARDEAEGLREWNGAGAVLLHAHAAAPATSVLLLERCRPGIPLAEAVPEADQDEIVAKLLQRLWQAPADAAVFRPLSVMSAAWAAEFEQKLAATPGPLDPGLARATPGSPDPGPARATPGPPDPGLARATPGSLDPGLARAATDLLRSLPATAERQVLLCTDLHAGNILAAAREPWLVIDPKPYVGDPTYDAVQHLLNCDQRLFDDPIGLAQRMAALLDLDPERLRLWLFARCVQESLDHPNLRAVAARLAPS
ncbi:aminoglycoside phosphotransferase family protein [Actinoplanes sp. NPDC024001]|uniref:aminoglycoside phosphotransferase family protein n=1 Tax=Actinoplanes sp. NPDC024001 TaxID=3154598 RepID=UPI0033C32B78